MTHPLLSFAAHIEVKSGLRVAEKALRVFLLLVQYLVYIQRRFIRATTHQERTGDHALHMHAVRQVEADYETSDRD